MEVMTRSCLSSTLNPNAPLYVPFAYRTTEDFSDEWWALIQSSSWFRDYWLRECFQDPQDTPSYSEFDDPILPDVDSLFNDSVVIREEENDKVGYNKELVTLGSLKWRKTRGSAGSVRNIEKVPKIVNVKVSPRPIQQPR